MSTEMEGLQKAMNTKTKKRKKFGKKATLDHVQKLQRTTLKTSRLLDFFSEKELTAQTGHPMRDWPLVLLKELLDNALDGCEDAEVTPNITAVVDSSGITVTDNGPGIAAATVAGVLDFSVRVSSREHYSSPTRGVQGNALKTIVAMPFVLDGKAGRVDISVRGVRHEIQVKVDRIKQEPKIERQQHKDRLVNNGTSVKVYWPDSAIAQFCARQSSVFYKSRTTSPGSILICPWSWIGSANVAR
jgi:DNA topoisomerase VI subunit B